MYEPVDPLTSLLLESLSLLAKAVAEPSTASDISTRLVMNSFEIIKIVQPLLDSPSTPGFVRDAFSSVKRFYDGITEKMENATPDSFSLMQFYIESLGKYPELRKIKAHAGWQLFLRKKVRPLFERHKLNDQSHGPTIDNTIQLYHDATFSEKDHDRIIWCSDLANIAQEQGNDEEAIRLLREGLSIPCSQAQPRILSYIQFADDLLKAKKLACRSLNAFKISSTCHNYLLIHATLFEAYMDCGWACRELEDYSEGTCTSYTKALELQHQHHPP